MSIATLQDPEIEVRSLDNPREFTTWRISQNLTDRWGSINPIDAEHKPLVSLLNTPGLLARLRAQMIDEFTFVVRKDGRFGVLLEVEYPSRESEKDPSEANWESYPSHAELLHTLVAAVKRLQREFPMAEWAIPNEREVFQGRLAIWGFFPDGSLTENVRSAVRDAIVQL